MTKRVPNQIYIDKSDIQTHGLEQALMASIGRKRSGIIRMRYFHRRDDIDTSARVHPITTLISYKFRREMECNAHLIDDRPDLMDLLHSDIPWVGLVQLQDPERDFKYRIEGHIRNMVLADNMVFQIRDVRDGSPYTEGLMLLRLHKDGDGDLAVDTTSGLKQIAVVEQFQGYPTALAVLKSHLMDQGYVQCPEHPSHMLVYHGGDVVSTIDIALVGKVVE